MRKLGKPLLRLQGELVDEDGGRDEVYLEAGGIHGYEAFGGGENEVAVEPTANSP